MRVAIYRRRSTDHQEESLQVQLQGAKNYAKTIGATIDEACIFEDKDISRAEYQKRPGLYAMLAAAEREPRPFDAIIIRDVDRLGGDAARNGVILSDLIDRGIQVHEYMSKNVVKLTSATDKMISMLRNYAAEIEREKVSARTRESHKNKALRSLVTGGRVFGYRNVRRDDGVHYEIDPEQAKIVRLIFERYAAGDGLKKIARLLNSKGIASPQAGSRGTGSWGPSVLQPMLRRERYRGVMIWGRVAKGYKLGTGTRSKAAAEEIVTTNAPDLQLIGDELWFAVQARIAEHAHCRRGGRGRPGSGRPARHLLSGIARCSECGGPITANTSRWGKERVHVYQCGWAKQRGPEVCRNRTLRPMASVNAVVIEWLTETVLTPEFVLKLVADLRSETKKTTAAPKVDHEAQAKKVRKEIDRLVSALAVLDDKPDALVRQIAERQKRLKEIEAEMAAAQAGPKVAAREIARVEEALRKAVKNLRTTLANNPNEARAVLASLFQKLTLTPTTTRNGTRFLVEGSADIGCLSALEANFASPTGFEPVLAA